MGKYCEEEEQELVLLYQPKVTDSAQNISYAFLLKLPFLRAPVPPSTPAICQAFPSAPLHMLRGSFSARWSAQNLITVSVRFQLELAVHLFALVPVQGTEQKRALGSASAPGQTKCLWTPICSGPVVCFSNWSCSHNSFLLLWEEQINPTLKDCPSH